MAHNFPSLFFYKNEINKTCHLTIAKVAVHLTYHLQMKVTTRKGQERETRPAEIDTDLPRRRTRAEKGGGSPGWTGQTGPAV